MSDFATASKHRPVLWKRVRVQAAVIAVGLGLLVATDAAGSHATASASAHGYIVQGVSSNAAAEGVVALHGTVLSALPSVHGIVAKLTSSEADAAKGSGLQVTPDLQVTVQGLNQPHASTGSGVYTSVTGATSMWSNGINGSGVTVAVLDTGIDAALPDFHNRVIAGVNLSGTNQTWKTDQFGHGTFVAGLIASNGQSSGGQYTGVAPGADLVSIKVAGASGVTSESNVIQGVAWAVAHEAADGIQVLNMSLGVQPSSPSALDPLDQAVEQAWDSGIVVVTSAGNIGPGNGTITSPGNDPLVITVGSLTDGGLNVPAGFTMSAFSSAGPTLYDGWFKPDLVAPGRSVVSLMAPYSTIYLANPLARIGSDNFVGSGTSFSTAIVSGLVALLLQQDPNLTPDQVKAALLSSTSPGPVGDPLVDGHGLVNVTAASAVAGQVFLNQGPAAAAESTSPPATVSLSTTWAASTWNPANWSGAAWSVTPVSAATQTNLSGNPVIGAAWNGFVWNGTAWNEAAWNEAAWNDAAWNGTTWNDAAWNDAAWNDAAWNDAAWNDAAWNSDSWS
jgi:serine protease AprX